MNTPTRAEDLRFGEASEIANKGLLEKFFGKSLKKREGMATLDFVDEGNTIFVELKTRRIRHDAYSTTLIGLNKVHDCNKEGITYYFAYCYTDGLYYIRYDKALFDTFERDHSYKRGSRSDCRNTTSAIVYIPITYLKKMDV
jgi:hypothetical protein